MKKLSLCLLLALSVLTSCSDDDSNNTDTNSGGGLTNNPLSGTVYGQDFTIQGGRAQHVTMFNVESISIDVSALALGCGAPSTDTSFPIRIVAPRQEGTFTTDVYVTFNDPNSTDYVSVSGGNTVEITSLTATTVKGKVRSGSTTTNNYINGSFELPICQP